MHALRMRDGSPAVAQCYVRIALLYVRCIPSFYMSRYSGIVDKKTGNVVLDATVASEVTAAFEWSWVFASDAYVETVTCRVDNVKTRGVPVPNALAGHINVHALKDAASAAVANIDLRYKSMCDQVICECALKPTFRARPFAIWMLYTMRRDAICFMSLH